MGKDPYQNEEISPDNWFLKTMPRGSGCYRTAKKFLDDGSVISVREEMLGSYDFDDFLDNDD